MRMRRRKEEKGEPRSEPKGVQKGPKGGGRHSVIWVCHSSGHPSAGRRTTSRSSKAIFKPRHSILKEWTGVSKNSVRKPTKIRCQDWDVVSQTQAIRVHAAGTAVTVSLKMDRPGFRTKNGPE